MRSCSGRSLDRRGFHRAVSGLAAAVTVGPFPVRGRGLNQRPTLIGIGVGGKGRTDLQQCAECGFDIVALVDVVDTRKLRAVSDRRIRSIAQTREAFPDAQFGTDYREMLDRLGDRVDAAVVSTPDHHHFFASLQAMQMGKHVYCQKPLTHGIWEARVMADAARRTGVQTQMGNQAHASDHLRRCVELIRAGVVGRVRAIHAWTNRPIWPQGFDARPPAEPVPAAVDWKQWIGPAPWTDYNSVIAPFNWRGWWDYGTGALGDMACHIMDLGYWAMQPAAPRSVQAEQIGATELSPPISSKITWDFGPTPYSVDAGFQFHWYDGYLQAHFDRESWSLVKQSPEYNHPDAAILDAEDFNRFGCVVIGEHGKLFFHRGRRDGWVLKADAHIDGFAWPEPMLPRAPRENNYQEWFDAIAGRIPQCESHFGLAGPMTETILLGVLAQRAAGASLTWNAEKLEVEGRPDLNRFIRRSYENGWSAKSLGVG